MWGSGDVDTLPGRYTAISISLGRRCALTDAGEVTCWGATQYRAELLVYP